MYSSWDHGYCFYSVLFYFSIWIKYVKHLKWCCIVTSNLYLITQLWRSPVCKTCCFVVFRSFVIVNVLFFLKGIMLYIYRRIHYNIDCVWKRIFEFGKERRVHLVIVFFCKVIISKGTFTAMSCDSHKSSRTS